MKTGTTAKSAKDSEEGDNRKGRKEELFFVLSVAFVVALTGTG
jgi:hypothetical protein